MCTDQGIITQQSGDIHLLGKEQTGDQRCEGGLLAGESQRASWWGWPVRWIVKDAVGFGNFVGITDCGMKYGGNSFHSVLERPTNPPELGIISAESNRVMTM